MQPGPIVQRRLEDLFGPDEVSLTPPLAASGSDSAKPAIPHQPEHQTFRQSPTSDDSEKMWTADRDARNASPRSEVATNASRRAGLPPLHRSSDASATSIQSNVPRSDALDWWRKRKAAMAAAGKAVNSAQPRVSTGSLKQSASDLAYASVRDTKAFSIRNDKSLENAATSCRVSLNRHDNDPLPLAGKDLPSVIPEETPASSPWSTRRNAENATPRDVSPANILTAESESFGSANKRQPGLLAVLHRLSKQIPADQDSSEHETEPERRFDTEEASPKPLYNASRFPVDAVAESSTVDAFKDTSVVATCQEALSLPVTVGVAPTTEVAVAADRCFDELGEQDAAEPFLAQHVMGFAEALGKEHERTIGWDSVKLQESPEGSESLMGSATQQSRPPSAVPLSCPVSGSRNDVYRNFQVSQQAITGSRNRNVELPQFPDERRGLVQPDGPTLSISAGSGPRPAEVASFMREKPNESRQTIVQQQSQGEQQNRRSGTPPPRQANVLSDLFDSDNDNAPPSCDFFDGSTKILDKTNPDAVSQSQRNSVIQRSPDVEGPNVPPTTFNLFVAGRSPYSIESEVLSGAEVPGNHRVQPQSKIGESDACAVDAFFDNPTQQDLHNQGSTTKYYGSQQEVANLQPEHSADPRGRYQSLHKKNNVAELPHQSTAFESRQGSVPPHQLAQNALTLAPLSVGDPVSQASVGNALTSSNSTSCLASAVHIQNPDYVPYAHSTGHNMSEHPAASLKSSTKMSLRNSVVESFPLTDPAVPYATDMNRSTALSGAFDPVLSKSSNAAGRQNFNVSGTNSSFPNFSGLNPSSSRNGTIHHNSNLLQGAYPTLPDPLVANASVRPHPGYSTRIAVPPFLPDKPFGPGSSAATVNPVHSGYPPLAMRPSPSRPPGMFPNETTSASNMPGLSNYEVNAEESFAPNNFGSHNRNHEACMNEEMSGISARRNSASTAAPPQFSFPPRPPPNRTAPNEMPKGGSTQATVSEIGREKDFDHRETQNREQGPGPSRRPSASIEPSKTFAPPPVIVTAVEDSKPPSSKPAMRFSAAPPTAVPPPPTIATFDDGNGDSAPVGNRYSLLGGQQRGVGTMREEHIYSGIHPALTQSDNSTSQGRPPSRGTSAETQQLPIRNIMAQKLSPEQAQDRPVSAPMPQPAFRPSSYTAEVQNDLTAPELFAYQKLPVAQPPSESPGACLRPSKISRRRFLSGTYFEVAISATDAWVFENDGSAVPFAEAVARASETQSNFFAPLKGKKQEVLEHAMQILRDHQREAPAELDGIISAQIQMCREKSDKKVLLWMVLERLNNTSKPSTLNQQDALSFFAAVEPIKYTLLGQTKDRLSEKGGEGLKSESPWIEMAYLVCLGQLEQAVEYAMMAELWSHALVLSLIHSNELLCRVRLAYIASFDSRSGQPGENAPLWMENAPAATGPEILYVQILRMLLFVHTKEPAVRSPAVEALSNELTDLIKESFPKLQDCWVLLAQVIVSYLTIAHPNVRLFLKCLGQLLEQNEQAYAAHVLYMFAGMVPGRDFGLLGQSTVTTPLNLIRHAALNSHIEMKVIYLDLDAFVLTEFFELIAQKRSPNFRLVQMDAPRFYFAKLLEKSGFEQKAYDYYDYIVENKEYIPLLERFGPPEYIQADPGGPLKIMQGWQAEPYGHVPPETSRLLRILPDGFPIFEQTRIVAEPASEPISNVDEDGRQGRRPLKAVEVLELKNEVLLHAERALKAVTGELGVLRQRAEKYFLVTNREAREAVESVDPSLRYEADWIEILRRKGEALRNIEQLRTVFRAAAANRLKFRPAIGENDADRNELLIALIRRQQSVLPLLLESATAIRSVIKSTESQLRFLRILREISSLWKVQKVVYAHHVYEKGDVYPYRAECQIDLIDIPSDIWGLNQPTNWNLGGPSNQSDNPLDDDAPVAPHQAWPLAVPPVASAVAHVYFSEPPEGEDLLRIRVHWTGDAISCVESGDTLDFRFIPTDVRLAAQDDGKCSEKAASDGTVTGNDEKGNGCTESAEGTECTDFAEVANTISDCERGQNSTPMNAFKATVSRKRKVDADVIMRPPPVPEPYAPANTSPENSWCEETIQLHRRLQQAQWRLTDRAIHLTLQAQAARLKELFDVRCFGNNERAEWARTILELHEGVTDVVQSRQGQAITRNVTIELWDRESTAFTIRNLPIYASNRLLLHVDFEVWIHYTNEFTRTLQKPRGTATDLEYRFFDRLSFAERLTTCAARHRFLELWRASVAECTLTLHDVHPSTLPTEAHNRGKSLFPDILDWITRFFAERLLANDGVTIKDDLPPEPA